MDFEAPYSLITNSFNNNSENVIDTTDQISDLPSTSASTSKFSVDRSLIQGIQHDEQDAELQSLGQLGLSVYHQDELEQGILAQVDQALEQQEKEQEKRRLDKQIKDMADNIRSTEQQLSQNDVMLRVMRGTPVSVTKAMSVRKEQDRQREQLTDLLAQQKVLSNKRSALDLDNQENVEGTLEKKVGEESEQERMIRLGEMTPFGTVLPKSHSEKKLTDFQKYFQSQAELGKSKIKKSSALKLNSSDPVSPSSKSQQAKHPRQKSALKQSVLNPKKRKKKEILGSKSRKRSRGGGEAGPLASETQTMWLDSDPDFVPESEDEDDLYQPSGSSKMPRRVAHKRRPMTPDNDDPEWKSDDSDWESSGDEKKIIKKRQKGQEMDDGDTAVYDARLRLWEKEQSQVEKDSGTHRLDGYLEIPNSIWNKLYKYQQVGVQWMWELYQNGTGGILGDEMGLGKTIQVIAFLAALKVSRLKDKHTLFRGLGATLVVCPTTIMHQWVKELHTWWPPLRVAILHESGSFGGSRNQLIRELAQNHGVLITSYQGLVKHQEALLRYSWHLLILDEGHKIRNPDAQATLSAKSIPTPHRIALTGSPMQNNLRELWSLFDFVYPSKLGTLPDFLANFAVPITQGGYANASEVQVATAYHCALSLKETIKPYLLRRMKTDVKSHINLPGKNEQVLFCKLTEEQRSLYQQYVDSRLVSNILEGRTKIFVGLINLRKICNHPDLFSVCSKLTQNDESLPEDERYGYWEKSGKMMVVQSLLKIWHKQGHRVLLFTQGRQMMCILEHFVQQEGYKYLKLDGTTSVSSRQPLIAEFNKNSEHFVFLLTTRVGGLGVNLTGADRVVIFDPDWNPATDTQARERAWRIGQQKHVTIYRLITAGTIEEKIYHRQIFKQFLTNKVLNDPRQRRFFKTNDLYELFVLKEGTERSTETSAIFAGTGSEVKVKPKPRRPVPKPEPVIPRKIEFSKEKIDRMKELAQKLSQKFTSKLATKDIAPSCSVASSKVDVVVPSPSDDSLKENSSEVAMKQEPSKSDRGKIRSAKAKKKKHKSKKRWHKGAKFEGERVSHLVNSGDYTELLRQRGDFQEEEEQHENQDDYVLRKLFKKSGLQTALQHDHIMDGGGSDVALVEREARHVAQEAIARLKDSQRQCFSASSGIPSWTGSHGAIKAPRSSEKPKKKKKTASAALGRAPDPEQETDELISGEDLIALWDRRNRLLRAPSPERPPTPQSLHLDSDVEEVEDRDEFDPMAVIAVEEPTLFEPDLAEAAEDRPVNHHQLDQSTNDIVPSRRSNFVTQEESDLLDELRCFLSFGAADPGQASTEEILQRFPNSELSPHLAPLFKCLLQSLADFHRTSAGKGMWKMKPEFR